MKWEHEECCDHILFSRLINLLIIFLINHLIQNIKIQRYPVYNDIKQSFKND